MHSIVVVSYSCLFILLCQNSSNCMVNDGLHVIESEMRVDTKNR